MMNKRAMDEAVKMLKQDLEAISAAMLNANDHITELLVKVNEMEGTTEGAPEDMEGMMPVPEDLGEMEEMVGPEEEAEAAEGEAETEENVEEAIETAEEAEEEEPEEKEKESSWKRKDIIASLEPKVQRMLASLEPDQVWPVGGGIASIVRRLDRKGEFQIHRARTKKISFLVSRKVSK